MGALAALTRAIALCLVCESLQIGVSADVRDQLVL